MDPELLSSKIKQTLDFYRESDSDSKQYQSCLNNQTYGKPKEYWIALAFPM